MADKLIAVQEKNYEVYTCSGKRITVKAASAVTFIEAGDLLFYDLKGNIAASFQLMNIEGWRVVE